MNIYLDGKRVDKNGKFIENSQSLLNQAYHTNKLISFNETSLARLTQRALQALNGDESLNSQEDSRTLNSYDKLIINSQEGLKFTQTQEAMKQEGSQALNKDEFLNSQEGLKALNKDENLMINSQEGLKTLNNDDSLINSQRNSQTLNIDENLIINSQEGLKFTQTQEAMKQKSLKFKEAQERMRYEFFNHLSDDELFNPLLADDENYAYVLEKNGPCSIAGELKLRIPEGRYEVSWHNGTRRKQTLKLHNAYISAQRYILIHEGYTKENSKDQEGSSPRNTFGCLIIAKDRIRDKNNPRLFADNILKADSSRKNELAKALSSNGAINSYLAKAQNKNALSINEVINNIEVRIINNFKSLNSKNSQATSFLAKEKEPKFKKQLELPSNLIRIETEDSSEEFIELEFVRTHLGQEASGEIIPLLSPFELFSFKRAFGRGFGGKTRILNRNDLISLIENKYKLPKDKGGAYLAKDNKQIKEIWEDLIKEAIFLADVLDEQGEYMIKRARLKDGTIVKLRKKSKSGGSTIEVDKKQEKQLKIHNKEKEDGDW